MTDKQSTLLTLYARFYEIQNAIDRTTDQQALKVLEGQKKELSLKIDSLN